MKTTIFSTSNICCEVKKNSDGTLLLTQNGIDSIPNAASYIGGYGGIEKFLAVCTEYDGSFDDFLIQWTADREERLKQNKDNRKAQQQRESERAAEQAKLHKEAFDVLAKSGVIETTVENIGIVLRYLNTQNWGSWTLPAMSVPYSAHQYDCDGKTASTITLDQPISDSERSVENETMFVVGAPHGHLTKYRRIR
jgi:hypothetical protein